MPHRVFRLLSAVWVGSLLTIGYAVAPVLFKTLERMTAGSVAGQLFRIEAILGVVCGVLLLALSNQQVRRGSSEYRRVRWIVAAMVVCVLVGYFALQPFMNALRVAAMDAGTDIANSPYASRFGMLHGVSSVFYLVESVLGLMLIWRLPARDADANAARLVDAGLRAGWRHGEPCRPDAYLSWNGRFVLAWRFLARFTLPPAVTRSLPRTVTLTGRGRRTGLAFGDTLTTLTVRGARPFLSSTASAALGTVPARRPRAGVAAAASGFQITSSLPMCWIGAALRRSQISS